MAKAEGPGERSLGSLEAAPANGAALAAFLGGSIGAFAMGFFVIVNEIGLFVAPSLYGPAGGVSGRTTFATLAWLVAWAVLHHRWKDRGIDSRRIFGIGLLLIGLGFVGTFPPVWGFF
jgi:hypothetical protein